MRVCAYDKDRGYSLEPLNKGLEPPHCSVNVKPSFSIKRKKYHSYSLKSLNVAQVCLRKCIMHFLFQAKFVFTIYI